MAADHGGAAHRAEPLGHVAPQQRLEQRPRRTPQVPGGGAALAVQGSSLYSLAHLTHSLTCVLTYVLTCLEYAPGDAQLAV